MPRVPGKMMRDDLGRDMRATPPQRRDIKREMGWLKRFEIGHAEMKEAHRRPKTPAVLGMIRSEKLFLQMDKRAGDLDQPFEETVILIAALQPEMFENIVRFVITLLIETAKVTQVMRIEPGLSSLLPAKSELFNESDHAVCFFHAARSADHGRGRHRGHFFRRSLSPRNLVSVIQVQEKTRLICGRAVFTGMP